jgi:hypothetical protein
MHYCAACRVPWQREIPTCAGHFRQWQFGHGSGDNLAYVKQKSAGAAKLLRWVTVCQPLLV